MVDNPRVIMREGDSPFSSSIVEVEDRVLIDLSLPLPCGLLADLQDAVIRHFPDAYLSVADDRTAICSGHYRRVQRSS